MSKSAPLVSLNIHKHFPTSASTPTHSRCHRCHISHAAHHQCLPALVKTDIHDRDLSELYDVADAMGSVTIEDTDDLEANLLMELARARREILRAEKSLADCMVREHEVLADLSKFKSSISERRLDMADIGLGRMRVAFRNHGLFHNALPHHALHSSPVESQATGQNITIQLD
ncbi:hypothetical protein DEU56DRAFT_913697 [Suillus clintonianus]|uniref:uncharacterized protein n=1 Tax=Suillus clintonianus TaxID=1904413 RepID=UPI001B87D36E|nr:uncharacterized protein DEU56DRAFT_913697 [Suillus clintonianus]KAG2134509.1 hypothetical protein DEU56DRAFT_913697 [Suillus clintonianus]